MTIKTRTTAGGTGTAGSNGKPFTKRMLAGIGGGVLIVAALAGFAAHQVWSGSSARNTRSVTDAISQPLSLASTGGAVASAPRGLTLYLVDSPEQATAAYESVLAQNQLLMANGAPDREATVRLVTSPAEVAQAREAVATFNALRRDNGLAPIQLVDLRGATVSSSAAEPSLPRDPVQPR